MSSYILGLVGGFIIAYFFSFRVRGSARVRSFRSLVGEGKIAYVRITTDIFFSPSLLLRPEFAGNGRGGVFLFLDILVYQCSFLKHDF